MRKKFHFCTMKWLSRSSLLTLSILKKKPKYFSIALQGRCSSPLNRKFLAFSYNFSSSAIFWDWATRCTQYSNYGLIVSLNKRHYNIGSLIFNHFSNNSYVNYAFFHCYWTLKQHFHCATYHNPQASFLASSHLKIETHWYIWALRFFASMCIIVHFQICGPFIQFELILVEALHNKIITILNHSVSSTKLAPSLFSPSSRTFINDPITDPRGTQLLTSLCYENCPFLPTPLFSII